MAKQSLVRQPVGLLVMTMVLVMALPPTVEADVWGPSMLVTFYNNMQHVVKMHCKFIDGQYGYMWFEPTKTYWAFAVESASDYVADYGGKKYWCGFQTRGKPLTYVDVFVGTGGTANLPCDCFGKDCQWTINDWGISCGAIPRRYVHKWGQPRQF